MTRCRYCHSLIKLPFTGWTWKRADNGSSFCYASPDRYHQSW